MTPLTIDSVLLGFIKNSGFNGFPYGLQDVSNRYILGSNPETTERIKIGDTFDFNKSVPSANALDTSGIGALISTGNKYQAYVDLAILYKISTPGVGKQNEFNDMIEVNQVLYAATGNGIAISTDFGKTWSWNTTMADPDIRGLAINDNGDIWFFTSRSLGYTTDLFTTIVMYPYTVLLDIQDLCVSSPRVIVCTSNGVYGSDLTVTPTVWTGWSPPLAVVATDQVEYNFLTTKYGLSYNPTLYTARVITYQTNRPYSTDFRCVQKIGSMFVFGTTHGIIYTDLVTNWWNHESPPYYVDLTVLSGNTSNGGGAVLPSWVATSPTDPKLFPPACPKINPIDIGEFYACSNGNLILIAPGSPDPIFVDVPLANSSIGAYRTGTYCVSIKTDLSVDISVDNFATKVNKLPSSGYTGVTPTNVFIASNKQTFLLSLTGLIVSTELDVNVSFDAILRIDGKVESAYKQINIVTMTTALVYQDNSFTDLLSVKGQPANYLFYGTTDPNSTVTAWHLIGYEPPYTAIKALMPPFGVG